MKASELAKRLEEVEREVANLKARAINGTATHPIHALEWIHGTFENDAAFREAVRLGRESPTGKQTRPAERRMKSK